MKKLVLSVAFVLATMGTFANTTSKNVELKDSAKKVELVKAVKQPVMCTIGIDFVIQVSVTFCCANC